MILKYYHFCVPNHNPILIATIACLLALDNSFHIVTKYYDLLSEENTFFANKDDDRSKVLFMYVEVQYCVFR